MFDVIEKAASTDPEKIIATWEGHEYHSIQGTRIMRPEDHQAIYPMYVGVTTYPTKEVYPGAKYTEGFAGIHEVTTIPWTSASLPFQRDFKTV